MSGGLAPATLTLRGVRRRFPGAQVDTVRDCDLEVPAGRCVALLGPSGVGKSTILRLAAGLDTPDAGQILIDGRDQAGVPTERRGTAMVFQRPRLFPHLSVLDNVAFSLSVAGTRRKQARADAARFLQLVGADELAGRRPGGLSGGQEQRVALARALAARPAVLLLDEPFSALDPGVRTVMHQLLAQLRTEIEPTILLVTHDQHEAAVVADTVAVLLDGRIAQHDPVDVLYRRPVSLAVSRFLGGLNEIPGTLRDGVHHSAVGAFTVPEQAGAPTLGAATLVIRQEAIQVIVPSTSDASDKDDTDVTGSVVQVRPHGARTSLRVDVQGMLLTAEVTTGGKVRPGDEVGLRLPESHRWVVPGSDDPKGNLP